MLLEHFHYGVKVFYFRYFDFVVPFPEAVSDFRFIGLVIVDVVDTHLITNVFGLKYIKNN